MSTKVTFVELTAYEGVLPLATGYLQAYASQDEDIVAECSFEIFSQQATGDRVAVADELAEKDSDVYAVSCYLWNMGITRWVLDRLHERKPAAQFILGGPQVMNHMQDYVAADRENMVVCNGEGERTFLAYLKQIVSGERDFHAVPGLSFWRDGELVTTPKSERIKDLNEIPSPFTTGVFADGLYSSAILETNRGCPYNCGFCAWGAATNDKVYKFDDERVREDITWISEHQFASVFIADANWGIAPRDVELTKFIVEQKERNGFPYRVDMAAAKNRPDRITTITDTLVRGGLVTSQTISLQSMDPHTLDMVQRSNIRLSAYTTLQSTLRERGINSNIELIWPLPGETLDSYQRGIGELCRLRGDVIVTYPQLLLYNTPIHKQRDVLGVQTARVPSEIAEADIVTSTNWVTNAEYEDGVWFAYVVHALYNVRSLYYLANYLDRNGLATFAEVYANAVGYFKNRPDAAVTQYFADSVKNLGNYDFRDSGMVAHMVLHACRAEFDELLNGFVHTQPWWEDEGAQAAFELDLLARPYIYAEPMRAPDYDFTHIRYEIIDDHHVSLTLPPVIGELLADLDMNGHEGPAPVQVLMDQNVQRKIPYVDELGLAQNALYCQGMFVCLRDYLPVFAPHEASVGV
ncbi:B12-binding domain-containing radical SAM protein [Amycolatopsis sp. NPDC049252]|uniref:B12-binding domain-containing radical SAM protein n=1 Tax=Amycolatopsis sp. NPDC049252 TaxID=3363933 RepID=UPI0037112E03